MNKPKVTHTTIRNEQLFCLHCGGSHALVLPIAVTDMLAKIDAFNTLHAECKKTWTEPEPNMSKSLHERSEFWYEHGERGRSSEVMHKVLVQKFSLPLEKSHPLDPDDFKRCIGFLKHMPEFKKDLHKLKALSTEWSNLVDNWDKLTEMYEQKDTGMFEYMKTLIRE